MGLPFVSEFKSEQRVIWFLYLLDIVIVFVFGFCGWIFSSSVHPTFKTPFVIYNIVVGILLTRKSRTNPKKRVYEALLIFLSKDKKIYKPVITQKNVLEKLGKDDR